MKKHLNDLKVFIECSNTMDALYENINDYHLNRRRKILIVFDDMIADIMANKKFQSLIKELFIRCRKLNISRVFINQSCFSVPKDVRLNSTHKNYKILQLIILHALIIKILLRCTENVQKNHIIF